MTLAKYRVVILLCVEDRQAVRIARTTIMMQFILSTWSGRLQYTTYWIECQLQSSDCMQPALVYDYVSFVSPRFHAWKWPEIVWTIIAGKALLHLYNRNFEYAKRLDGCTYLFLEAGKRAWKIPSNTYLASIIRPPNHRPLSPSIALPAAEGLSNLIYISPYDISGVLEWRSRLTADSLSTCIKLTLP